MTQPTSRQVAGIESPTVEPRLYYMGVRPHASTRATRQQRLLVREPASPTARSEAGGEKANLVARGRGEKKNECQWAQKSVCAPRQRASSAAQNLRGAKSACFPGAFSESARSHEIVPWSASHSVPAGRTANEPSPNELQSIRSFVFFSL